MNQNFYRSAAWKRVRDQVIIRDNGCDLGIEDRLIGGKILIHHMNPIRQQDIMLRTDMNPISDRDIINLTSILLNPEYLICVSHNTHNAIHYGDKNLLIKAPIVRTKNDTCPWKR